jgi:hypothetical protein
MLNRPRGHAVVRRWSLLLAAVACALAVVPAHTQKLPVSAPPAPPALTILWDQEMLSVPSPAMDVRWASDHTVFVAWLRNGVSEVALDGKFTALRNLFPDASAADPSAYLPFDLLAVSNEDVVAASRWNLLGFRTRAAGSFVMHRVAASLVQGIDVSGGRLLLLGDPVPLAHEHAAAGIAWLGRLSDDLEHDLQPVLTDFAGVHTPTLLNCSSFLVGAARFLPDGSFIVVPGFQPGAYLLDATGHLLRTWDTKALGLDVDAGCAAITSAQRMEFGVSAKARGAYLNQHRALDGILPLAQGPGLIIRSVADGQVHWQIVALQANGTIAYDVPFTGSLPYERLRGDVRGNRVVLLRGPREFDIFAKGQPHVYKTTHLYVTELPRVVAPPAQADLAGGQS